MIQRLNPVTVSRPRPPKLTPATASISLHDAEEGKEELEGNAKVNSDHRKRDSRTRAMNDDDDNTLETCEERAAADPTLVKAATATGTAQILETLRAREDFKWDFEGKKHTVKSIPFKLCVLGNQYLFGNVVQVV